MRVGRANEQKRAEPEVGGQVFQHLHPVINWTHDLLKGNYLLYVSKSIIETKICQESCFLQKHMVYSCHENIRPGRYSDTT